MTIKNGRAEAASAAIIRLMAGLAVEAVVRIDLRNPTWAGEWTRTALPPRGFASRVNRWVVASKPPPGNAHGLLNRQPARGLSYSAVRLALPPR